MNRKKVVLAVLIWPLGAYWLVRHFGQSRARAALAAAVGLVALIVVISAIGTGGKDQAQAPKVLKTTTSAAPATRPAPARTAKPKAQWELIISQSSCQESPANTSINCSIGIKNRGGAAGQPTVYALYHYTDGSETTDLSSNDTCRRSDDIPPGQLGYVYFCHNYDPLKHHLVRAAVTLNSSAHYWPNVRIANTNDTNWPTS